MMLVVDFDTTLIRGDAMGLSEDELQSVDEDTEAPRRVSEAASDLGTGLPSTKKAAESLVLAVGGVSGFDKDLENVR